PKRRRFRSPGRTASRHQCFEIRGSLLREAAKLGKRTEADACTSPSLDCTHQRRNSLENALPIIARNTDREDSAKPVYARHCRLESPTNKRINRESDQTGRGNS